MCVFFSFEMERLLSNSFMRPGVWSHILMKTLQEKKSNILHEKRHTNSKLHFNIPNPTRHVKGDTLQPSRDDPKSANFV